MLEPSMGAGDSVPQAPELRCEPVSGHGVLPC
jgi:hypothetical protein